MSDVLHIRLPGRLAVEVTMALERNVDYWLEAELQRRHVDPLARPFGVAAAQEALLIVEAANRRTCQRLKTEFV